MCMFVPESHQESEAENLSRGPLDIDTRERSVVAVNAIPARLASCL